MKKLLNKINTDELLQEATELLKVAFSYKNMGRRYQLYNEANDLKKIATILYKWEEMIRRGDY